MILILHFIATVFMTGVIWIVQVVTYPQLRNVPSSDFIPYEKAHMQRISMIVGPVMLLEIFTAIYLLIKGGIAEPLRNPFYISIGLGIIIALSTALMQAPIHGRLAVEGKVEKKIKKLIISNWVRTISWSGRTVYIAYIIYASI